MSNDDQEVPLSGVGSGYHLRAGDQVCSPARQRIAGQVGWSMEGKEWSRSLGDGGIGDATGTAPFDWKGQMQDSMNRPVPPSVKIDSGILPQPPEGESADGLHSKVTLSGNSQTSAALARSNDAKA